MKRFSLWTTIALATVLMAACRHDGTEGQVQAYVDFLYRYMPLPDRAAHPRAFYEWNTRLAMQARREMAWGQTVPEREFRHFVLPVRVNNEQLDSCRGVFYEALKPRVQGLSMEDAILEVNHWCHEHVTYRPTDARTSSPLATLRTAYGRCGEESTFTVAALRAVGIPARQVYTPRWAHTDDNHAWVEAWANGQWHFLGACEPEPVLDLGWFNESASRGMLMHTKVFGDYDGPEEVMARTPCYTEINVISHYAPTSQVSIHVVDASGQPVDSATVEFKLYNYAEFYTVARKMTDATGTAQLTAGRGDMLVWVSRGDEVTARRVSFATSHADTLVLCGQQLPASFDLDLTPPAATPRQVAVSDEQRAENNRRLAAEDSVRRAYEATMPNEAWRGNHIVIQQFLSAAPNAVMAQRLLSVLSAKDLRDVTLQVLRDNAVAVTDTSLLYCRYVLCPRVENEWLTPYKGILGQRLNYIHRPEQLVAWCNDSLTIDRDHNPQHLRMHPLSTYRERTTDELGRDIFFVSAARSLGMPARLNEVNGKPQYYNNGQWVDVAYADASTATPAATPHRSRLLISYQPMAHYDDPKYYTHFTLSKLEHGQLQLMTFAEDATWANDFRQGVELDDGEYLLVTGTRLASGKVLAHGERFTLGGHLNNNARVALRLRSDATEPQVVGSLNAELLYHNLGTQSVQSLLATTGRGYYVLGIVAPNHEPTNHALRDISACAPELEAWGRSMVLLFEDDAEAQRFNHAEHSALPQTVVWGVDRQHSIATEAISQMHLDSHALPIFLICDTFNRVVFVQQGYTINLGEQLQKVIRQL